MSDGGPVALAHLQARVLALESALERRSRELRLIQSHVCSHDLVVISQILAGSMPVQPNPFDIGCWVESVSLTPSDVEEVMRSLWRSTSPRKASEA